MGTDISRKIQEKIEKSLNELYGNYDPVIYNPFYRGPPEKRPYFTTKQVHTTIPRGERPNIGTLRTHLNRMAGRGLLLKRRKRFGYPNEITYEWAIPQWEPIQLVRS